MRIRVDRAANTTQSFKVPALPVGTVRAYDTKYPVSILNHCGSNQNRGENFHPTQKPVALMDYLIRTYTQPGDTVLDPFAGSGTTLVAAQALSRHFIGIEMDADYVATATRRLTTAQIYLLS